MRKGGYKIIDFKKMLTYCDDGNQAFDFEENYYKELIKNTKPVLVSGLNVNNKLYDDMYMRVDKLEDSVILYNDLFKIKIIDNEGNGSAYHIVPNSLYNLEVQISGKNTEKTLEFVIKTKLLDFITDVNTITITNIITKVFDKIDVGGNIYKYNASGVYSIDSYISGSPIIYFDGSNGYELTYLGENNSILNLDVEDFLETLAEDEVSIFVRVTKL